MFVPSTVIVLRGATQELARVKHYGTWYLDNGTLINATKITFPKAKEEYPELVEEVWFLNADGSIALRGRTGSPFTVAKGQSPGMDPAAFRCTLTNEDNT